MIHVGIIGCGKIAQVRHIPEYLENSEVALSGYYDLNSERAKALSVQYGGKAYSSYAELLADPAIDAVSVCTANHTHAPITIDALHAGKHVLCEKPMAISPTDCERMVEAARGSGKVLMIDHNQRFTPAHRKAKALLEAGELGKLLTFRTCFAHGGPETWSIDPGRKTWFFDKKRAVLGAMVDLGVHKTDLIQYLTGEQIVEVCAMMDTLDKKDSSGNKIGVDDNVICLYRMESGLFGSMTASWTCYAHEENTTTLYGTKGVMKLYYENQPTIVIDYRDGTRASFDTEPIQTNSRQTKTGVIDEFVSCILTGRTPESDGATALSAMRVIFQAVESARTQRVVSISPSCGEKSR